MPPVMLALSTFRQSEGAVKLALERAESSGSLVVLYVVDVNLARYFIGTDVGFYPDLMKKTEAELLEEHKEAAEKRADCVAARAREKGIDAQTRVTVGRFAQECLLAIRAEHPKEVITTRSNRPGWVRRFFGSPVDELIQRADCPVLEV